MTETRRLSALIEQHARKAVLPVQSQGDSYIATAEEENYLGNMRHILHKFAAALLSEPQAAQEVEKFASEAEYQNHMPHCAARRFGRLVSENCNCDLRDKPFPVLPAPPEGEKEPA